VTEQTTPTIATFATADLFEKAPDVHLTRATSEDAESWDEFVDRHPEGRFCHLWGYRRALEQAAGYECVYFNILSGGQRVGVFPSVAIHRGRGRLVSQPFNEYGGPLMQALSAEQQSRLPQLLLHAAEEEDCHTIEIRGGAGCEPMVQSELCRRHPLHFYGTLDLAEKEQLWRKSLTYEARKDVARAQKAGLTTDVRHGTDAVGGHFYDLYQQSMKRLGVPPHSHRFFSKLAEGLGNRLVGLWVSLRTSAVAVLLGAMTGKRLHIFTTASDRTAWPMRPNDLAHWKLIEWAVSAGIKTFDFGSARYAGQIQFKKKWGVSLREYACYTIAPPGSAAGARIPSVRTDSRSMAVLARAWRTLVPTGLARVMGPSVRRYLTK
jgi:hypothetical protein